MHDIASAYQLPTYRFFLGNFIQTLFLTNLKYFYIVFKKFDNQRVSSF